MDLKLIKNVVGFFKDQPKPEENFNNENINQEVPQGATEANLLNQPNTNFNLPNPELQKKQEQPQAPPTIEDSLNTGMSNPAAFPNSQTNNIAPPPVSNQKTTDFIHKKVAALEVRNHLLKHKTAGIIACVGYFGVLLGSTMGQTTGAILVVVFIAVSGYFLSNTIKEIKRLEFNYRIDPKFK